MRIISVVALVAFLSAPTAPASAGMVEDCEQGLDRDLQIGGCTAVIRSGEWQGKGLSWAYNNRANAYGHLGEHRRAIEDYDVAIRLDPGNARAYSNRGVAYKDLGEHRRAIEDYDQAIRIDPEYASAYRNRGRTYHRLGEYRQAIESYDQALRFNPGYADAYQNRGVTYESLGDFERAASDWEQAVQVDGASRTKWWQGYMKGKGFYAGAVDGVFGPATRRALLACAIDPAC